MTSWFPYFGFDAAADGELAVVMMRRGEDGSWQVEQAHGPQNEDMSRVVARICAQHPAPAEPEWACEGCGYHNTGGICTHCGRPANPPLTDQVAAWMAKHGDITMQLTDEQQAIVHATFGRLISEGKLRL
jgi:hypothetical protein